MGTPAPGEGTAPCMFCDGFSIYRKKRDIKQKLTNPADGKPPGRGVNCRRAISTPVGQPAPRWGNQHPGGATSTPAGCKLLRGENLRQRNRELVGAGGEGERDHVTVEGGTVEGERELRVAGAAETVGL